MGVNAPGSRPFRGAAGSPRERPVQVFYGFAVIYLAIGLGVAWRLPGRPSRSGPSGQLARLGAVLAAGLFWPERYRAG
jgi:hypothetical protein